MTSILPPTIKEYSEYTLNCKTKYELVKELAKLQKNINRAIKKLDNLSNQDVRDAIRILRGEGKG